MQCSAWQSLYCISRLAETKVLSAGYIAHWEVNISCHACHFDVFRSVHSHYCASHGREGRGHRFLQCHLHLLLWDLPHRGQKHWLGILFHGGQDRWHDSSIHRGIHGRLVQWIYRMVKKPLHQSIDRKMNLSLGLFLDCQDFCSSGLYDPIIFQLTPLSSL